MHLAMVLICIFPIINEVKHLCIYLFMFLPLWNLPSLTISIELLVFILLIVEVLDIFLDINPFCHAYCKYFPFFMACLFILLIIRFDEQKTLNLRS